MKKIIIIISLILCIILAIYTYKLLTYTIIIGKFKELRPIKNNIPVYYKGIVIGKAKEKKHSSNYEHTLVKFVLYPKNLHLPTNTTVELRIENKNNKQKDFFELIYPKNPKNELLSSGATIEGISKVDIETFIKNQHPDDLEAIKQNLIESTQNLNYALQGLSDVFNMLNEILNENKNNLYNSTKNLNNMTLKINNAIQQEKINNSINNLENTTKNLNNLTGNSINTVDNLNSTICEIQGFSENINSISCGIKKTLSKKMGGLRLFFGQVIDENYD